jgi:NAD(P)-dependent dehydrogenase (short-subunit alcohol dehydrogenase family)
MKKQEVVNLFDIAGKVAIVTGATGSLGGVAAKTLAAAGVSVMLTARDATKLAAMAKEITTDGGKCATSVGDPAKHEDATRVVQETVAKFGGIDILVTAAGANKPASIHEQTDEEFHAIMSANVDGTYYFCREVGKVLLSQGRGGKVIIIGSVRGNLGYARYSAYCTSKGATHLLAKTLGCEWGPHKINVNAIAPAVFRAAITEWLYKDENAKKGILSRIPIGRLGEPEDFAGAVMFLSSKASDWVTGHVLCVDGGYSAG